MWAASLTRITLAASLAVAGGLSLMGLLASLPGGERASEGEPSEAPASQASQLRSGSSAIAARPAERLARESTLIWPPLDDPAGLGSGGGRLARLTGVEAGRWKEPPVGLIRQAAEVDGADAPSPASADLGRIAPAAGSPRRFEFRLPLDPVPAPEAGAPADAGGGADQPAIPGVYVAAAIGAPTPAAHGAAAAPPEAASPPYRGPRGYVIIGSFPRPDRAARFAGDHQRWRPQILTTRLDGTLHYRVAVGPFRAADLPAALARITGSGIADAWLLAGRSVQAAAPLQSLDILS